MTRKKLCFEIRHCPASMYLSCPALDANLNCWETDEKPCCRRNDFERCKECEVYLTHLGYTPAEIKKIIVAIRSAPDYVPPWKRSRKVVVPKDA